MKLIFFRSLYFQTRLALGVAALPVLGVIVCVEIGFCQSRVWQISFWCSPTVCQAFGRWGLVSVCICAFGVGGVPGLSGGGLGCLLGSLCLVLCGRLLPSMLAGTDG